MNERLEIDGILTVKIVPRKKVEFRFPSGYEDTSEVGDNMWDELMPREYYITKYVLERKLEANEEQ